MRHLPLDERGYPVPWFVHWIDGKPDFRVVRPGGAAEAWNGKLCWLCGHPMGVFKACVVGPMCGINRTTSEPPSHLECATYAVRACPFMTRPLAVRRERDLPAERSTPGLPIARNPGVALLWVTRHMKPFRAPNGWLFNVGEPTSLSFWREGRRATRAEIDESVRTGLPALEAACERDRNPARSRAELKIMQAAFNKLLPAV